MSNKVIVSEVLQRECNKIAQKVRSLRKKIYDSLDEAEIYSYIERVLNDHGYTVNINRDLNEFSINVSPNFYIVGEIIRNMSIGLGMGMKFEGHDIQTIRVNFPISDLEIYLPFVDMLISECIALNEKYVSLMKDETEIYSHIERVLSDHGYTVTINRNLNEFTINVSPNFYIVGKIIHKMSISLGIGMKFEGHDIQTIGTDVPISDLGIYLPIVDMLISECIALNEKYVGLMKIEKSSALLETLVLGYIKNEKYIDTNAISVSAYKDGTFRLSINSGGVTSMKRTPIDFNNYKSLCDKWFNLKEG